MNTTRSHRTTKKNTMVHRVDRREPHNAMCECGQPATVKGPQRLWVCAGCAMLSSGIKSYPRQSKPRQDHPSLGNKAYSWHQVERPVVGASLESLEKALNEIDESIKCFSDENH